MKPHIYRALQTMLLKVEADKICLRFAGGEPTLVFDIWEPFARSMLEYENVSIEVLTNLIDPPKDFWKFAELENVNISVSVDSGKSVKVLDKAMVEKLGRLRNPWLMTTVTTENVGDLEVLAAVIGMNNYGWCITTDYLEKTVPDWETLTEALLNVIDVLKQFDYDLTRVSFNNFTAKSYFTGCRAGDEMFSVGCDGSIYKCQTLIGNPKMIIGDVYTGYKRSKCLIRKECEECTIYGLCKGWCQLYYNTPHPLCKTIKIFANEVLREVGYAK